MTTPTSKILEQLADREAIRECLCRYARGVDRLDADMVRSAYWPDAKDTHLDFTGNVEEFIAWSFPIMKTMEQTQHHITNIIVNINGEQADVESYFWGYHRVDMGAGKQDVIGCGRYVDRFQKRGDEWRVQERLVLTDWWRIYPDSADWSGGLMGQRTDMGKRMPEDPSYTKLKLI